MATLARLELTGTLVKIEVPLGYRELPNRQLFGSVEFVRWLEVGMPTIRSTQWSGDLTVPEQVIELFTEFVSGKSLVISRQFKCLDPAKDGIWELKTGDVRIFGWFPKLDCFIAVRQERYDARKVRGQH